MLPQNEVAIDKTQAKMFSLKGSPKTLTGLNREAVLGHSPVYKLEKACLQCVD